MSSRVGPGRMVPAVEGKGGHAQAQTGLWEAEPPAVRTYVGSGTGGPLSKQGGCGEGTGVEHSWRGL